MVSIIVPVYEEEKYLGICLDSLLTQTYTNFEIIVIDDASQDGSVDIIKKYKEKDERIRCFFNEKNMGAGPTRNVGIENALGNYLTFIDCDDWVDEKYLETMVAEFEKDSDLDLVLCGSYTFDGRNYKRSDQKTRLYETGSAYVADMLTGKVQNGGGNHSKMYNRRVIQNVRYRAFRCAQDGLFSRECLSYLHRVKTVDYNGYYYRMCQEVRHETRAAKTENFYEKQIECSALTIQAAQNAVKNQGIKSKEVVASVQRFKWSEFEILYRRILFDIYIKMSVRRRVNCIKSLLQAFYPPGMVKYANVKKVNLLYTSFKNKSFMVFYMWMLFQPNSLKCVLYTNILPKNTVRGKLARKIYFALLGSRKKGIGE